ncbi:type II toxin-antitoxin system RelE family toxin [Arthrobacter sp. MA-N2]|uniref:type II toxin-antitoxin system RelE family toxin n=1 Tax=Arthrobacter sp. MA-N2 TaxID=1101188 RepID=UPI0004BBB92E|nr:hypothetical protein [Arthrobacter sp. MA-N2]
MALPGRNGAPCRNAASAGAKKLSGSSSDRRVRAGDYRIIDEIRDAQLIVRVLAMGPRRDS